MSYYELTDEELNELRWTMFYMDPHDIDIPEDIFNAMCDMDYPSEITLDMLEKVFGGYSFVEEDFWCNLTEKAQ